MRMLLILLVVLLTGCSGGGGQGQSFDPVGRWTVRDIHDASQTGTWIISGLNGVYSVDVPENVDPDWTLMSMRVSGNSFALDKTVEYIGGPDEVWTGTGTFPTANTMQGTLQTARGNDVVTYEFTAERQ